MKHQDFSNLEFDRLYAKPAEIQPFYISSGKRIFDLFLAVLLLPVLLPVILALWIITTASDRENGFFGHVRIGKNGRAFRCWKIRTMVVGAQGKLERYLEENPEAAAEWAADFKLSNDPRITGLGRFLRKTSLDELPQIWNVICGDMSFVGPRPVVEAELEQYGSSVGYYLSMKPGITGIWQVSGRNNVRYIERVAMDRMYNQSVGLLLDIKLIVMTAMVVVRWTGK